MRKELPHNAKFKIARNIVWREVEHEAVVLNLDTNHYFTLNQTGTAILKLCAEEHTLASIARTIIEEYAGDEALITKDVHTILAQLIQENILEVG